MYHAAAILQACIAFIHLALAEGCEEAPASLREHEVPLGTGGHADQEGGGPVVCVTAVV